MSTNGSEWIDCMYILCRDRSQCPMMAGSLAETSAVHAAMDASGARTQGFTSGARAPNHGKCSHGSLYLDTVEGSLRVFGGRIRIRTL